MTTGIKVSNYARPGSAAVNAPSTPGGTGAGLGSVTDGTTTVSPATELDFTSGATVTDLGGGIAGVAVTPGISGIEVKETDGTPDVTGVTIVQVPPHGLTDNTGGNVTLEFITRKGGGGDIIYTNGAVSGTLTVDLSAYNVFDLTLVGNTTLVFSNPPAAGGCWTFYIRQGGTGSYTLAFPAAVKYPASDGTMTGSAPALFTAVNALDTFIIETENGGTDYGATHNPGSPLVVPFATPTIGYGTPAAGAATTAVRSDATIARPAEADISTSDVTTGNVSTSKHGWAPKAPNDATKYLDGTGAYSVPPGSGAPLDHEHIGDIQFTGDGATTAFELPAAPFDAYSVAAFDAGVRTDVTLSGYLLTTMTFAVAPAAGHLIIVDLAAAAA